jgi:putative cardiolipin synthase
MAPVLRNLLRSVSLLAALGLVVGCASLPTDYPRTVSKALSQTDDTQLGRSLEPLVQSQAGQSGVHPLGNGVDAFVARLALARVAERSLDVQYYLFHNDTTGLLLAGHLLQAADRGVRVRLLLDDMDMGGRDAGLAAIDQHPNIEIRLFNPFPSRSLRVINFLTHFGTVTRRMHNKSFTVDNQATIVGGRNIGDEYFDAAEGTNFGDMDLLAVGPITREVSDAFDRYWNSDLAVPVQALTGPGDAALLDRARDYFTREIDDLPNTVYGRRLFESDLAARLIANDVPFHWGTARLIYDLPEKVRTDPDDRSTHMGPEFTDLMASAESELIAISPYFVPGKDGTAMFASLVERGVRVTVVTNALAATDVPAVHSGYSRYRRALIAAGVELYEVKPTDKGREERARFGESQASLHAKTLAIDGEQVVVGSMNLDPRSDLLNTEMGVIIDTPVLAARVGEWRDQELPKIAWRVELEAVKTSFGEEQRLVWISREDGEDVRRYDHEPEATLWARIQASLSRLLPIEHQL